MAAFACATPLFAQEPADALRYSWYIPGGSARQQAIGGAMTSLGGDISATFVNPAGLGFYRTSDFVLTPGYNFLKNKSTYYGRTEKDDKQNLSFGTTGVVSGFGGQKKNGKSYSTAVSLAINRTASFGDNLLYRGLNNQNSYSQKFLEEIASHNDKDANSVASNYPFGTSLAFNTYWIDTIAGGSSGNYQFQTRAPIATGLIQENRVTTKGGITELALGLAANRNEKWLYGLTVGVPFLWYDKKATFTEADATANTNNKFDYAYINENVTTKGTGVNLKLGVIYKPVEYVRLGLAVHTPTFFVLTDKYNASVTTNTESYQGEQTQSSSLFTNGTDASYKYWMFTPYRVMFSGAYVLREVQDVRKQRGFITADIEYVNYKSSSYTTASESGSDQGAKDYFKSLNRAIDNAYKGAFNFKVGGELKFTTIMARLGAAYYGNPYKDLGQGEKGRKFQLSGGLGYRNKGIFIDATYVYTNGKDMNYAYRLANTPFSGAAVKTSTGNIVLTVGFKI